MVILNHFLCVAPAVPLAEGQELGMPLGRHSKQGMFSTCWGFLNISREKGFDLSVSTPGNLGTLCPTSLSKKYQVNIQSSGENHRIIEVGKDLQTFECHIQLFLDITLWWRCELILQFNYNEPSSSEEGDFIPAAASAVKQLLLSWLLCVLSAPAPMEFPFLQGFQQHLAVVSPLCWMFIIQEQIPHGS